MVVESIQWAIKERKKFNLGTCLMTSSQLPSLQLAGDLRRRSAQRCGSSLADGAAFKCHVTTRPSRLPDAGRHQAVALLPEPPRRPVANIAFTPPPHFPFFHDNYFSTSVSCIVRREFTFISHNCRLATHLQLHCSALCNRAPHLQFAIVFRTYHNHNGGYPGQPARRGRGRGGRDG